MVVATSDMDDCVQKSYVHVNQLTVSFLVRECRVCAVTIDGEPFYIVNSELTRWSLTNLLTPVTIPGQLEVVLACIKIKRHVILTISLITISIHAIAQTVI